MSVSRTAFTVLAVAAALAAHQPSRLRPGIEVSVQIGSGGVRTLVFSSAAPFVEGWLAQGDLDFAIRFFTPQGRWESVDSFDYGNERIALTLGGAGATLVEISGPPGAHCRIFLNGTSRSDTQLLAAVRFSTQAKFHQSMVGRGVANAQTAMAETENASTIWHFRKAHFEEGATHIRHGSLLLRGGSYEAAIRQYGLALAACPATCDPRIEAEVHNGRGLSQLRLGDVEGALQSFDNALARWTVLHNTMGIGAALNNRAMVYRQTGEFERAIQDGLVASNDFRRAKQIAALATALSNRALPLAALGRYDEARANLLEGLQLLDAKEQPGQTGQTWVNLGFIYQNEQRYTEAISALRKGVEYLEKAPNIRARADAWNWLGTALWEAGDRAEAVGLFQRALDAFTDPRGKSSALYHLGVSDIEMGRPTLALLKLRESFQLRRELRMTDEAADAMLQAARAEAALGRKQLARRDFQEGLSLVESQRTAIADDWSRISYFAVRSSGFEQFIEFEATDGHAAQAFEVAETSLARGLLDELGLSRAEIRKGADIRLLEEEARAQRRLNVLAENSRRILNAARPGPDAPKIRREIDEADEALRAVEARIRAQSPRYAAYTRPRPAGLHAIQHELGQDTALIEIWPGQRRSYAWVVTQNSLTLRYLPSEQAIASLADSVTASILARDRERFVSSSRALSAVILVPVLLGVAHHRLAIVASGALSSFQFAALPDPAGSGLALGVSRELVRLPSASALVQLRADRRRLPARSQQRLVVFADAIYDPRDSHPQRWWWKPPQPEEIPLARLLFTQELAHDIQLMAPDTALFSQFRASKAAFLMTDLTKFRMVHIGVHTRINEAAPDLSEIAFSSVTSEGNPQDGSLHLYELYNQVDLNADCVVLGACDTAGGRRIRGEGVFGLLRGFFFAGARAVVASHWDTDDAASREFFRVFYRAILIDGMKPSAALRAAQSWMSQNPVWRDPIFSAAYSFYGDWEG